MSANYLTPFLIVSFAVYVLCVVIGGALGARAAHGPAGRGALAALIAVVLQIGISFPLAVENILLQYGIFVLLLILIGRLWLKLTATHITGIALGSFILPAAVVGLYFYGAYGI